MKNEETQVLHIHCADEKGLIYRITEILYSHGLNIVNNQEFVDAKNSYFFMRTEFEGVDGIETITNDLRKVLPTKAHISCTPVGNRSVVLMASKEPHCLGDLLLRHKYGELTARVKAVVSNHEVLAPLCKAFDMPFHHIPAAGIDREAHEASILDVLANYAPDYLVLAKYMRIFTPSFVERYPHRIINIHHSFLPAFVGASPYRQAYRRGVKVIGATAHIVTDNLDEGPIIAQDVLPVNHSFSADEMAFAGRDVEKNVLAKALKLVLQERVFIYKNRTIVFD